LKVFPLVQYFVKKEFDEDVIVPVVGFVSEIIGPGLFFDGKLFITDSMSLLMIDVFTFLFLHAHSWQVLCF
jgi:hypothetical protein